MLPKGVLVIAEYIGKLMKIIVDADACPKSVLQYVLSAGRRNGISVVTVANFHHNIESDKHIAVGDASQEADLKIINETEAGDIVVTQDWGLAAVVLAKKAHCVSPVGIEYSQSKIDFMLEEREIKAKFRRSGGRTKGPAKRSTKDDEFFAFTFDKIIRNVLPKDVRDEKEN